MKESDIEQIDKKLELIIQSLGIKDVEPMQEEPKQKIVYQSELDEMERVINGYLAATKNLEYEKILKYELDELNKIRNRVRKLNDIVEGNHQTYLNSMNSNNGIKVNNPNSYEQTEKHADKNTRKEIKKQKVKPSEQIIAKKDREKEKTPIEKPKTVNQSVKQPMKQMEYRIGGELFGIIGSVMILIALITLGRVILPVFAQGMALFAIPLLFYVLSVYINKKELPTFSKILMAISSASAYIIVFINYFYMHTINALVALIISAFITIVSWLISKKTENISIKIISTIGFYLSLMPGFALNTPADLIVMPICLFMITILDIFLKTNKNKIYSIINLFCNAIANCALLGTLNRLIVEQSSGMIVPSYVYIVISTVLMLNAFITMARGNKTYCEYGSQDEKNIYLMLSIVTLTIQLIFLLFATIIIDFSPIAVTVMMFLWVTYKGNEKNSLYGIPYVLLYAPILILQSISNPENMALLFWTGLFGILSVSYFINKDIENQILNTAVSMELMLLSLGFTKTYSGIMLAATLVMIFSTNCNKKVIAFMIAPYITKSIMNIMNITTTLFDYGDAAVWNAFVFQIVIVGISLLYKASKSNKCSTQIVVSSFIWSGLTVWLMITSFYDIFAYWISTCMTSFLVVAMANSKNLCLPDFDKAKPMIFLGMTTGFVILIPAVPTFGISIMLLMVAASAIGIGFKVLNKNMRVYGLVLSLIMTCKLLLWDIDTNTEAERIIMFLLCGIIILTISYLYNKFEKRISEKKEI